MSHTPGTHTQEVFYNKIGSTGAVVCSCGFAITFTALADNREEAGRAFFARMHEHRDGLIAAAPELAAELKHATDHINDLRIVIEQAREMGLTLHMCGVTYDHEKALAVLAKATGGAK